MRRTISSILITISILLTAITAYAATAKVTLKANTEVQSAKVVKLSDVATIQVPQQIAQSVGDMIISTGPLPGQSRTIDASYVKAKLDALSPNSNIKLLGPSVVSIVGKCTKISSQVLAEDAKNFVLIQLPIGNRTYEAVVDRMPRDLVLPGGNTVETKPRILGSSVRSGLNTVAIDAIIDGRVVTTASVTVQVKAVADVLVAVTAIRQGETLNAQNTRWDQRDVTKVTDPIVMGQNDDALNFIARRTIREGCVITSTDVQLPAAIHRGDTITLVVKCGRITLNTTAQAKQDARVGDSVSVQSAVSQESVVACVIGPGLAEIRR